MGTPRKTAAKKTAKSGNPAVDAGQEALQAEIEAVQAEESRLLEQAQIQATNQHLQNRVVALGVQTRRLEAEVERLTKQLQKYEGAPAD